MTLREAIALMGPLAATDRALLKTRYRRLAFLYHPDRNGNSSASFALFTRINRAYHLLDGLLASGEVVDSQPCLRCGQRPARLIGLDRNPYCRDCLVYAGGRRLLPAPPTVVASCALAAGAQATAFIALCVFLATGAPRYGVAALALAGAGLIVLAASALLIGQVAPARLVARRGDGRRARRRMA